MVMNSLAHASDHFIAIHMVEDFLRTAGLLFRQQFIGALSCFWCAGAALLTAAYVARMLVLR